ncbi:UNVERIFIED_CONTAM: hypothetical protein FKN15_027814 [Acipenser sinensis]
MVHREIWTDRCQGEPTTAVREAAGHETGTPQSPPPTTKEDPPGTPPAVPYQGRAAVTHCFREDTAEEGRRGQDAAAHNEPTACLTLRTNTEAAPVQGLFVQFELFAADYDWTDRRKATYVSQPWRV